MTLGTLYADGPLCPFTHRVQIAAGELGAQIDIVYDKDIPEAVREGNSGGTWPAFAPSAGGDLLQDSAEIIDHLINHSGTTGDAYRVDPGTLAKLDTLIGCISKVILAGKPRVQGEFRGKLDLALAEVELVRAASGGPFLGGDQFSQADGHVAPFLHRLPFLVEIRNHVPEIFLVNAEFAAWVDRVVNRRSFQDIAPRRNVLRQFYAAKASYGKPMKIGRLHHSGFRGMWDDVVARASAAAADDDRDNTQLQGARDLCYLLFRAVALHAKFENLLLFPALDAAKDDPGFTSEAVEQHAHEEGEMNALLDVFDRALNEKPGSRRRVLAELASACARLREGQFAHFDFEETNFLPVLSELELEQHLDMLEGAYEMCILERPHLIGVLASYMPIENILSLLDSLLYAVDPESEQWRTLLSAMHNHLSAEQWLRVMRRFEDVLPISLMVVPSGRSVDRIGTAARALQTAAPVERIEIPGVAAAG
jgi:glutathione S-transferase